MPRRSKISHLPDEMQDWLRGELRARGFADYDAVVDALNDRLRDEGMEVTISRTSLVRFAQGQKKFAKLQREADAWAQQFLSTEGVDNEAHRHKVLFGMLSGHAFRSMANAFQDPEDREDLDLAPRDLQLLGRMLKDLMTSSGIREAITDKERRRLIEGERKSAADRAVTATRTAGVPLTPEVAAEIRRAVQGGQT